MTCRSEKENKFPPRRVKRKKTIQELVKGTYEKYPVIMSELDKETKMSKFKVGDKCKCVGLLDGEDQVEVMHTLTSDLEAFKGHVRVRFHSGVLGLVPEGDLILINSKTSPIRTVTTTEIVAGTYGKVNIFLSKYSSGPRFNIGEYINSVEELRESGELLIKLADALDNGAKVVAK